MTLRRRKILTLSLGGVTLLVIIAAINLVNNGPTVDIRTDCGDLRYRFLGIPVGYDLMPEPQRTALLSAASKYVKSSPTWERIVDRTGGVSNSNVGACRFYYWQTSFWVSIDPAIAGLLIDDLANKIHAAGGTKNVYSDGALLFKKASTGIIPPDWLDDQGIQAFCEDRGYHRPEWLPAATTSPTTTKTANPVRLTPE